MLFSLLFSLSAAAATLGSCAGLDSIGSLVGAPKFFRHETIRVAYVSTEEPAAAPDHLLIFVHDEDTNIHCASVNAGPGTRGFGAIEFPGLTAKDEGDRGLLITFSGDVPAGDRRYRSEEVKVRVNPRGRGPRFSLEN